MKSILSICKAERTGRVEPYLSTSLRHEPYATHEEWAIWCHAGVGLLLRPGMNDKARDEAIKTAASKLLKYFYGDLHDSITEVKLALFGGLLEEALAILSDIQRAITDVNLLRINK